MKYILIFLSSFIVCVANAEPPDKDVNVVNTPNVNVVNPLTATISEPVEANITGPIDANINGPVEVTAPSGLNVNVQNMPGVTIENGPLEPVPVIEIKQGGIYFQASASTDFYSSPGGYLAGVSLSMPQDPIAIESVTYYVAFPSGGQLLTAMIYSDNVRHNLTIPAPQVVGSKNVYSISIPLKLYAPNGGVNFFFQKEGTNSQGTIWVSFSGQYLDEDTQILKN